MKDEKSGDLKELIIKSVPPEKVNTGRKEPTDSYIDSKTVDVRISKPNKLYPIRFSASKKTPPGESDAGFADLKDKGLYERSSLTDTLKYFLIEPDWLMKKMKFPEIAYKRRLKLLILDNEHASLGNNN